MPTLQVPYFSQREEEALSLYGRKACGLTSLRMVFGYYGRETDLGRLSSLALAKHAYTEETGWIHAGLLNTARAVGLHGFRINYSQLSESDLPQAVNAFRKEGASEEEIGRFKESFEFTSKHRAIDDLKRLIDQGIPVITSMEKSYAQTSASHMVVVMGYEGDDLIINDPWDFGSRFKVPSDEFERHWTKRAIVIYDGGEEPHAV